MSQAKKRTAAVAGFCFFFAVILLVTALTVYNIAGDKDTLATQMRRHSVPEYSGLSDSEYPEMGKMIAVYLTGGGKTFQYSYTDADGNTGLCGAVAVEQYTLEAGLADTGIERVREGRRACDQRDGA